MSDGRMDLPLFVHQVTQFMALVCRTVERFIDPISHIMNAVAMLLTTHVDIACSYMGVSIDREISKSRNNIGEI